MNRQQYYDRLKALARDTRVRFNLSSPRVLKGDFRRIYKAYGIRIDLRKLKTLRGAYLNDPEIGPSVLLNANLPLDPFVFTMGHELKHHLVDQEYSGALCHVSNESEVREIGAEVFAAELIFPEGDFVAWMGRNRIRPNACDQEVILRIKNETRTTLSYTALVKRAELLGYCVKGSLAGIKWKKLETQRFGSFDYREYRRRR